MRRSEWVGGSRCANVARGDVGQPLTRLADVVVGDHVRVLDEQAVEQASKSFLVNAPPPYAWPFGKLGLSRSPRRMRVMASFRWI